MGYEIKAARRKRDLLEEIIGDAVVEGKGDAVVDLHLLGQGVDVDRPHVGPHRRHPPAIAAGGGSRQRLRFRGGSANLASQQSWSRLTSSLRLFLTPSRDR